MARHVAAERVRGQGRGEVRGLFEVAFSQPDGVSPSRQAARAAPRHQDSHGDRSRHRCGHGLCLEERQGLRLAALLDKNFDLKEAEALLPLAIAPSGRNSAAIARVRLGSGEIALLERVRSCPLEIVQRRRGRTRRENDHGKQQRETSQYVLPFPSSAQATSRPSTGECISNRTIVSCRWSAATTYSPR